MNRHWRAAAVAVLLGVVLTGCARKNTARSRPNSGNQGSSTALAAGKLAPEIEGEDIDGQTFKLSDYRGKVVLLDFWGNW